MLHYFSLFFIFHFYFICFYIQYDTTFSDKHRIHIWHMCMCINIGLSVYMCQKEIECNLRWHLSHYCSICHRAQLLFADMFVIAAVIFSFISHISTLQSTFLPFNSHLNTVCLYATDRDFFFIFSLLLLLTVVALLLFLYYNSC